MRTLTLINTLELRQTPSSGRIGITRQQCRLGQIYPKCQPGRDPTSRNSQANPLATKEEKLFDKASDNSTFMQLHTTCGRFIIRRRKINSLHYCNNIFVISTLGVRQLIWPSKIIVN